VSVSYVTLLGIMYLAVFCTFKKVLLGVQYQRYIKKCVRLT